MHLLVVDDNATNRKLLRAQLEAEGHTVVDAVDGVDALAALEREPVDAVISDILMPNMDGFRLCREIRQHERFSGLPFILYTSTYDSPADRRLASGVDADGYVIKPAPTSVILDALREAMRKARERSPSSGPAPDDNTLLKQYSEVLVHKLEEKNTELQQALERLEHAQLELLDLNRSLEQRVADRTAELERVNQQLEIAGAHKSQFLATMSHELRTPLNSILGFSELLDDPPFGQLDDEQRTFVRNIHASGKHLLGLINDILDLSKVAAGKIELQLEPVDAAAVVQSIATMVRPMADKKNLSLRLQPPDGGVRVLADAVRLKQVLYNLLSNAIKFTPDAGHIDLRCDVLAAAVQFSIEDDGIGIAAEDQERIFEEFQQVESTLSRQFEGTGLGLTLTRNFVRLQGGELSVTSAPGRGSTFTFTLPRSADADADAESAVTDPRPAAAGDLSRPTILIIEDDSRALDLITTHLIRDGYHVLHATDGEDGIRKARDWQPFAIVLDIMLPPENGWAVLAELKATPSTRTIPVIIMSVLDDDRLGFSLGAAGYLRKPVNRADLIAAVKNLSLTRRGPHAVELLIVDNDPRTLELVGEALAPYSFRLHGTTDSAEAMRLIKETRPALVILDLTMSGKNSFDVLDAMRADPASADIPVLLLNADELPAQVRERLHGQILARMDVRGVSPEDLLAELRKLRKWFPSRTPIVDGATALFNAAYFDKRVREEIARGERYARSFSMVLVTVDSFDDLVEAHGPPGRDLVLERFSRLLERNLRAADPVARIGAYLFAVLLPETIGDGAVRAAEKLGAAVQAAAFTGPDGQTPAGLSVSIGLASYPEHGASPEELETAARRALWKVAVA